MLKLKLEYFGYLMRRTDFLEKTLMLGKIEGGRRGQQRLIWHHQLKGHEFEHTPGDGEGQGSLACCSPWGHKESNMTERLNDNVAGLKRWQMRLGISALQDHRGHFMESSS